MEEKGGVSEECFEERVSQKMAYWIKEEEGEDDSEGREKEMKESREVEPGHQGGERMNWMDQVVPAKDLV